ncbi:MAG: hypothetical protein GX455_14335 [Phycisphaerae bacterium]|nr:hypothetical protein [Phycisphaerae bacterium]
MDRMNCPSRWIAGLGISCISLVLIGCQNGSDPVGTQSNVGSPAFLAETIATYYDPQQVRYLTRQEHRLDEAGKSLVIRAQEPDQTIEWSLFGGQFSGPSQGNTPAWCDRRIATLVLTAFRAASGLIDDSSLASQDPTKIDGQWYLPLILTDADGIQVRLMKKQSDSRIDRLELIDQVSGEQFVSLAYNPVWIETFGKPVPTKIDIFRRTGTSDRIVVQFHYRTIRYTPLLAR